MTKSILQDRKECFVTGSKEGLHKHHIYGGANRRLSEQYGFYVYLRPEWHNMSEKGVHWDSGFDKYLKELCQAKFEETHTRDEFMQIIGRSYL